MTRYADTAFICSLYGTDCNSAAAASRMRSLPGPLPFVWLHQIEFRNAIRLRVFRKQLKAEEAAEALAAFEADFADGVWQTARPDWSLVVSETERLSAAHAVILGIRTLDVLQVAAALVLQAEEFLTFDKRQALLARAAGLGVPSI